MNITFVSCTTKNTLPYLCQFGQIVDDTFCCLSKIMVTGRFPSLKYIQMVEISMAK